MEGCMDEWVAETLTHHGNLYHNSMYTGVVSVYHEGLT